MASPSWTTTPRPRAVRTLAARTTLAGRPAEDPRTLAGTRRVGRMPQGGPSAGEGRPPRGATGTGGRRGVDANECNMEAECRAGATCYEPGAVVSVACGAPDWCGECDCPLESALPKGAGLVCSDATPCPEVGEAERVAHSCNADTGTLTAAPTRSVTNSNGVACNPAPTTMAVHRHRPASTRASHQVASQRIVRLAPIAVLETSACCAIATRRRVAANTTYSRDWFCVVHPKGVVLSACGGVRFTLL